MNEHALTREQIYFGMSVTGRWMWIREQAKMPIRSSADITKSCLLARLLMGEDPLPDPPPTAMSAPWYELIDSGEGVVLEMNARKLTSGSLAGRWSIEQCFDWFEVALTEDGHPILDRYHRWTGERMGERWSLTPEMVPMISTIKPPPTYPGYRLQRLFDPKATS